MGSTADHQPEYESATNPEDTWLLSQIPPAQWEKQPPCPITEQVVKDLKTRSALGLMKYGVTLARRDLTLKQWLIHQYEELLDAAKYCKRAIVELEAREQSDPFNPLDHENMK